MPKRHYCYSLWVSLNQKHELSALDILRCARQHAEMLTTIMQVRTAHLTPVVQNSLLPLLNWILFGLLFRPIIPIVTILG